MYPFHWECKLSTRHYVLFIIFLVKIWAVITLSLESNQAISERRRRRHPPHTSPTQWKIKSLSSLAQEKLFLDKVLAPILATYYESRILGNDKGIWSQWVSLILMDENI